MSFFTKKIIDSNPDVFGIDISDFSIKVMQIKKGRGRDYVKGYASVTLPQGCIENRTIVKKNIVIKAIKKAIKAANIETTYAICSLPETKAFLRIITLPKMKSEEVSEAIKWELEMNIPMNIEQVYYDWQFLDEPIFKEKKKISILTVAISKTIVDSWLSVLTEAGLEVQGFDMESISQLRSLFPENVDDGTFMIVDIGDKLTSFLIAVNGIPVFTSSIPLSSEVMINAISSGMGVSRKEAEKVIIMHGIGSIIKNDHIFEMLKSVLENFITEIDKTIEFFVGGLGYAKNVDKIILCGGGAKTKGIVPYFSRRLQREVVLGNPWENVNFGDSIPPLTRENSVQYTTVIGLAIKNK